MGTRETPSSSSEPRWGYQNIPDIIGILCTYYPRGCHSVVVADDIGPQKTHERESQWVSRRPTLIKGDMQLLFGGMGRLTENSIIVLKNKSHSVTAQIIVPEKGAEGVTVAQGGAFGGWSLYAKAGKLTYCYNCFGLKSFFVRADEPLPAGNHQVRMEFAYDGGGLGKGGNVTLYVDGKKVGEGRVEMTVPMLFSADETCDVGSDLGTSVSSETAGADNTYNGRVLGVQLDAGKSDADRYITAEDRLRIAMARQQAQ